MLPQWHRYVPVATTSPPNVSTLDSSLLLPVSACLVERLIASHSAAFGGFGRRATFFLLAANVYAICHH